ncbi:MAG TPA: HU family DNA-binding protein [Thermotogota bacterium]|nr:HU family DNA-binding protein [Thermotogota bacterium]HRW92466.1 HU family DNA-binding protein [Thermotogota bacterium]
MNKKELVDKLSEQVEITKKDSARFLEAFIHIVESELESGGNVRLVGFGTFQVKETAARNGVDPRTKKRIKIPAKKVPKFVPGKGFKEMVR